MVVKRISILAALLSMLFLLGLFFYQKQASTQIPKEYVLSISGRYKVEKAVLKTQPPVIPATARMLKIKYQRYTREEVGQWFGAKKIKSPEYWTRERTTEAINEYVKSFNEMLIEDGTMERMRKEDPDMYPLTSEKYRKLLESELEDSFYFEDGPLGVVEITSKGRHMTFHGSDPYISGSPPSKITFSEEEADRHARAWIDTHGGFPEDAQLVWTRNISEIPMSFEGTDEQIREKEKPVAVSYYLYYKHKFDDRPVKNDEIKIKIMNPDETNNNTGIDSYYRRWSEPIGYTGAAKKIIRPEEAIQHLAKVLSNNSVTQSGTEPILYIRSMNLVYYDPEFNEEISEEGILRPGWALHVENASEDIVIDAYTGKAVIANRAGTGTIGKTGY